MGVNIYTFLGQALQIQETINISKLIPSPNALFPQVIGQLSRSTLHIYHLSPIQTAFTQFASAPYNMHTVASIQQHLVSVDAPCIATIPNTSLITPATERTMLPTPTKLKPSRSTTSLPGSDDDDSSIDDDAGLCIRAIHPTAKSPSRRDSSTSSLCRRKPTPDGRRSSLR